MLQKKHHIFARLDKETARKQWSDRFNNRAPATRAKGNLTIKAQADGSTDILLYDEIGYWGVTAKDFIAQLGSISSPSIRVRINSPGGDVFDGLAIYNALKQHPGEISCVVEGLAASAASFIALAGKRCVMAENSLMMCHCAWGFSIGNKADMMETAVILEKIDAQLAGVYAAKTGKSPGECLAMMAGEGKNDGTWFTAQEAKDYGLVDELLASSETTEQPDAQPENKHDDLARRVRAMRARLAIAERD
ncbi:head maturation protease, ClpP-related [Methylosinus sp. LW4]|uniref:head maturation protease, ClpP-related n=1 Tax=Methylosinus sp. LW4 TaxID=136993 RepID=UPI0009FDD0C1|nr:head maturation protease, ClpP-related [Methylosinus sp. LW4]